MLTLSRFVDQGFYIGQSMTLYLTKIVWVQDECQCEFTIDDTTTSVKQVFSIGIGQLHSFTCENDGVQEQVTISINRTKGSELAFIDFELPRCINVVRNEIALLDKITGTPVFGADGRIKMDPNRKARKQLHRKLKLSHNR